MPVLAPLRRAHRAADLAAVVLPHGRARGAGDRGRRARRGADRPRRSGSASTSTGCATSGRGASRASSGGATGCPVWYCDECGEIVVAESAPEQLSRRPRPRCARTRTSSTPGSRSALWPFATLGWPDDTPELRAFYPTDFLTTAREIIFLWVARMVMMGLEFTGEIPFRDVYVHSVIQAPDGRRMSKSLGTGIDPLDEIETRGADALRFGLLVDVLEPGRPATRRSAVQQGLDLANKMWNASRLILLNADAEPAAEPGAARGPLDPVAAAARDRVGDARTSTPTTTRTPRRSSTASSGPSCATGTSRSSSRGSTTASPRSRRTCCTCSSGCSRSRTR